MKYKKNRWMMNNRNLKCMGCFVLYQFMYGVINWHYILRWNLSIVFELYFLTDFAIWNCKTTEPITKRQVKYSCAHWFIQCQFELQPKRCKQKRHNWSSYLIGVNDHAFQSYSLQVAFLYLNTLIQNQTFILLVES